MKFLLDDSPGKPKARPPMWSEIGRRYFQKRYLWPSILLALAPFLVFRLVVFYDITFPFQPPGSIPVTVRSGQRLMQRVPWNNVGDPSDTRLDGELKRVHKSPLIRPDEDAWITHDAWINQAKSNRRPTKERQSAVTETPSGSSKVVEKFGLPDENEKDERGKTDGKKKTRAGEEFAAFQVEKRMAEERAKAAEAEAERARKNLEKERKKKNRRERQRRAEERKRANEQREAEERKVKEEEAAAEEKVAEEKRKAEEEKRFSEHREAEEKKREEEKAAAAQRKAEEKRKEEEEKRAAEQREAEQKKIEEERAASQAREAEEKRKEEEQKKINDETTAAEERKAEEKRKEEEQKKVEEEKAAAEEREAEERRKEEEEKKAAKQRDEEQKDIREVNAAAQGWESDEQKTERDLKRSGEQKEAEEKEAGEQKPTDETNHIEEQKQTDEQEQKEEDHEDSGRREDGTVPNDQTRIGSRPGECDLFDGGWEYDPEGPLYTNSTCFYIEGYQDCMSNGRPDSGYLHWKWKPRGCDLPRFDASAFLEAFKGKTIGFVGDSLARNQMQSLLCMLSQVEVPIKDQDGQEHIIKWLYEQHQVTLVIIWSPYLLKHSEKETIAGYEDTQSVLYLDVLDPVWTSMLPDLDIIVLSIGQWYFKPSLYIQQDEVVGCHYCPTMNLTEMGFYDPYRNALRQVLEKVAKELKGIAIMSTFAIQHFEHGPWESGGDCRREKPIEMEELSIFGGMHNEMHDVVMEEFNRVAYDKSKLNEDVHLDFLDVTKVSLLRADGHPGPYRRPHPYASLDPADWVQNDCLHWCLPGPVDTWNQLLVKIAHRYL